MPPPRLQGFKVRRGAAAASNKDRHSAAMRSIEPANLEIPGSSFGRPGMTKGWFDRLPSSKVAPNFPSRSLPETLCCKPDS
jgi:hypothetical protein